MKILWITNILFPEASALLNGSASFKSSGGWMVGLAEAVSKCEEVELYVATAYGNADSIRYVKGPMINYVIIPFGKGFYSYNPEYEPYWKQVVEEIHPDVVHIHGTEYTHGLAYIRACGARNVVVSVQGLTSVCQMFYLGGMTRKEIIQNITLYDLRVGTLYKQQAKMRAQGQLEEEMLRQVKHVIGRTSWDKAHVWSINSSAEYHFCNEVLRSEFYDGAVWAYEKCQKHSIFLSQGNYPLKGLHQVLKALPIVLKNYPDTKVRIAGANIISRNSVREKLKFQGYPRYILSLIEKYSLSDCVTFTGQLDAEGMKREYLSSNVFVCPSSIENSPNSLCEAQILGVPCVASYAGGIPDLMSKDSSNLFRFDDCEMLAYRICEVFAKEESAFNADSMAFAHERHNPETNARRTVEIYKEILYTLQILT